MEPVPLELRFDGPEAARRRVVLGHGAGAPADSPFMGAVARGLAAGGVRVARFEFPYMRARRAGGARRRPDPPPVLRATWEEVASRLGPGWALGGKSLGGRTAVLAADALGAPGVVCLGYPFHPPREPGRLRVEPLVALRAPVLVAQGERDPFGTRAEVAGYALPERVRVVWLPDGDHSFEPRAASGHTFEANLRLALCAVEEFLTAILGGD